jgi:hypothetical protein
METWVQAQGLPKAERQHLEWSASQKRSLKGMRIEPEELSQVFLRQLRAQKSPEAVAVWRDSWRILLELGTTSDYHSSFAHQVRNARADAFAAYVKLELLEKSPIDRLTLLFFRLTHRTLESERALAFALARTLEKVRANPKTHAREAFREALKEQNLDLETFMSFDQEYRE